MGSCKEFLSVERGDRWRNTLVGACRKTFWSQKARGDPIKAWLRAAAGTLREGAGRPFMKTKWLGLNSWMRRRKKDEQSVLPVGQNELLLSRGEWALLPQPLHPECSAMLTPWGKMQLLPRWHSSLDGEGQRWATEAIMQQCQTGLLCVTPSVSIRRTGLTEFSEKNT